MMFLVHSHHLPDYMSNTVSLVSDDPGRRRLHSATSTDYHFRALEPNSEMGRSWSLVQKRGTTYHNQSALLII